MIQTLFVTVEKITCCYEKCGIIFGLDSQFIVNRKRDHGWWYCPNGHQQCWPLKSDVERLKEQAEEAERAKNWAEDSRKRAWQAHDTMKRKFAAEKGVVTKIKKRVSNGVCPCCQRSFQNLMSHMKNEHPSWKVEEVTTREVK